MKIVMLTFENTHVEYVFENLEIYKIVGREIFCSNGTVTLDRYIILDDEVEAARGDEITPELLALDKKEQFISKEVPLKEQVQQLDENNKKLQEEKEALEARTNSMENSMLMMMDMFEQIMGKSLDLPF